jgi:GAF domain-containing protein
LNNQSSGHISNRQDELLALLESLHLSAAAMPDVQALDEAMESILAELTEKLNFEFAAISLVDEYRDCIETVRGRNISPGWIMRAKHGLKDRDIQTHIVNTRETKVIAGWDDLLDKEIYERFEHSRLARVWAPILSDKQGVIGTIEAGCNAERKDEVLTESAIERVKQLGCEKGEEIARKRPHILLKGIAQDAIRLIGADSATLHVYRRNAPESSEGEKPEWGELILAAGAGKATPEFVQSIRPSAEGRGRTAIRTGEPQWVDDASQFETDYPELHKLGVRALAVVPLKLGPDTEGVLGIHFWRSGKHFTLQELNLAEMFAREMEGVIQNYLLLRRATEAGGRAWALSGLQSLMQSLTSPFSLPDVLQKVARNALLTLDADNVSVYQYHSDKNDFYVPPVLDGQFLNPASVRENVSPDPILFEFVKHGASQFIVDAHKHSVLAAPSDSGQPRFIDREKVKSCAVLVLRSGEKGEIVGLLFVNFRQVHNFSGEEKRAMDALATSAALAIRNARLHKGDLNRQLEAMHAIFAAIAEKGPDLKQVLERLLQQTLALTGAKYGVCMRWNEHTELLEVVARWPVREDYPTEPQRMGEGIIGLAAKSMKSILVDDFEDQNKSMFVETVGDFFPAKIQKRVNADTGCEIAVPLLDEGGLLGVLNVEHPKPRGLTQDDRVLMQTLAVPAIIAFHTVDLYKRLERRIRHLSALNLVAERVQGNPYELDTILRLFLTGITAGAGLGFSRAMLFLTDKEGQNLCGESAIGPVTRREAEEVWDRFEQAQASSTRDLDSVLQQAERFTDDVLDGKGGGSPLSNAIREISFPIKHTTGAAAECLLKGETVTIERDHPDPFREVLGKLTQPNDVMHAFACVPLVGKHTKRVGVLVVDNRFLWKELGIDSEDVGGLEAFAGLLALTIENTRLRERMAEEQAAGIAHTIGTRLGLIPNKVTILTDRLSSLQETDLIADVQGLLDKILSNASDAAEVLKQFRTFAAPIQLQRKVVDLNDLVRELCLEVPHPWLGQVETLSDPMPLNADSFALSNAFMEVIKNAHEAVADKDGKDSLISIKVSADVPVAEGKKYVTLEIADRGPGIPDRDRDRIFVPFVTSKGKNGTGLGLPNARKVIEKHGGTIEPRDNVGGGARFVIRLPLHISQEN